MLAVTPDGGLGCLPLSCGSGGVSCVHPEYGLEVTDAEGCFNRINAAICAILDNKADTIRLEGGAGPRVDDPSLEQVVDALAKNSSVTALDLSMNDITDAGAVCFSEGLRSGAIAGLREIAVDGNRLTCVGVSALCSALSHCPTQQLTRLDLSCNAIGDDGAAAVAEMLAGASAPPLFMLYLRQCGIGDAGCRDICAAVGSTLLHTLHLSANNITDASVDAICDMASASATLGDLSLANNDMTYEALDRLAKGLHRSSTLECVHLSWEGKRFFPRCLQQLVEENKVTRPSLVGEEGQFD